MRIIVTNAARAAILVPLLCDGCGEPAAPDMPVVIPPGPSYDGVYRGSSLPAAGTDGGCGAGGPVTVLVMGNKFFFRWTRQVNLEVHISPDGTLRGTPYGSAAPIGMDGTVSGGHLRASVGGERCRFNLELTRA